MIRPAPRPSLVTPVVMAVSILAAVLAAGGTSAASPEPVVAPNSRPAVILRMEEVGGFAPIQASLLRIPVFTLYDDGSIIYQSAPAGGPDDIAPPLRFATLSPSEVDRLVRDALDRVGGLRDARSEYAVDGIADATTTLFTVNTDGVTKSVSVYGLGFGEQGPDREAIRRFEALAGMLADPSAWLSTRTEVTDYVPSAYRAVFTEDDPEGPDLMPWPWDDLTPADLVPIEDATAISQVDLTPQQAALVAEVPNGGAFDIAIAAPDGRAAWRVALRPLLPDEATIKSTPDATLESAPDSTAVPTSPPSPTDDEDDYGY